MPVISIRVSDEWLAYVDAEAERCRWKRNAAVVNLTWDGLQVRGALDQERSGRGVEGHAGEMQSGTASHGALTSGASSRTVAGKTEEEKIGNSSAHDDTRGTAVDATGGDGRIGNGAAVPILRKAKGKPEQLHPVQRLRSELAGGGDAPAGLPQPRTTGSPFEKCPHGKLNAAYCRATGGGC